MHFRHGPIVVREPEPQPIVVRSTSLRHEAPDLAEITAGEEARSNRIAVEKMLRDHDLDYELEHLGFIEVRLVSGTRPDRIHAAMSASHLFEGIANLVFRAGQEEVHRPLWRKRSVGKKHVRNRISAFIDLHCARSCPPSRRNDSRPRSTTRTTGARKGITSSTPPRRQTALIGTRSRYSPTWPERGNVGAMTVNVEI